MTQFPPPPPHTNPWTPWRLLGNPFRRLDGPERLAALIPDPSLPDLDSLLARPIRVIQFVGPPGAGKTTHLRSILTWLNRRCPGSAVFQYLPEGSSRLTPILPAAIWIIDEAQRLTSRNLRRLLRETARTDRRLILSSHIDLSPAVRTAGLTCETVALAPVEQRSIQLFFNRRMNLAALPGCEPFPVSLAPDALRALHHHAQGSLERAEHLLYALFQERILPQPPGPLTIDGPLINTVIKHLPTQ